MDRRTFFAALSGVCFSATALRAQQLPLVDDLLGAGGNVAGGALNAGGDILGGTLGAGGDILGGTLGAGGDVLGLDGGDTYRIADLMGGEFSIQTSRLALERSRSRQIRDFAQLEINEQTGVAAALGAGPGSVQPRPDQAAIVRKLANTRSGGAFDHAYVVGQIKGHEELLANNTAAINSAADPAIRRVATLSVPTIQTHLAILRRLRAGLASV